MVEEIVANDGVIAISSLFNNGNDSYTQLDALTALENIMRTMKIKEDVKEVLVSLANNTDNEEISEKAFDLLQD